MRRGTTPTLTIHVDRDLTGCEVRVLLSQRGRLIVKTGDDLELKAKGGATAIRLALTQAETLSLSAARGDPVEAQVRYKRGESVCATGIGRVAVERLLEEGAM